MSVATLDVCGDELRVMWTGSVWQSPTNGTQHARCEDAMRCEVKAYYSACGEAVAEKVDEIEDLLTNIVR